MKKHFLLVALILFFTHGCKKDNPVEPPPQNPDVIISPDAKVLSDSLVSETIISISQDSSIFVFSSANPTIGNLKVGNFIVSDNELGFLRKIVSIQNQQGQISIGTTQAALTDIIQKGSASVTRTLSPKNIARENFVVPGVILKTNDTQGEFFYEFNDVVIYDHDNNSNTEGDQILLNGFVGLEPSFTFNIKIDNWQVKELTVSNTFKERVELSSSINLLSASVEKEKEIASYQLNPIIFFIGAVPVVITPNLIFKLHFKGEITASIETSIEQTAEITAGITYANNSWNPFANESHNFEFQPPTFNTEIEVEADVGPEFNLMLYGVVGPYAHLSLFGELEVEIIPDPTASLYTGIRLRGGVYFKVLSHTLLNQHFPDILGIREKVWEQNNFGGKVNGIVKDALTHIPISGCNVSAYKNENFEGSINSSSDGTYELPLPVFDSYKIKFTKEGYLPAEYYNISVGLFENIILETVLQIDENYSGNGDISGTIKNALTGLGVEGARLYLRKGINVISGSYLETTLTDNSGYYQFSDIEAGNYTIETSKSGYNKTYFSAICLGNSNNGNQDATISPVLNQEEIRIVLTWGVFPYDLDSHLTGPLSDGERFHMYYPLAGNSSPWPSVVNLDLDDVWSYGPETTTLYEQISGIYRFSVHDFSNLSSTYSFELSNSSAQVRVYSSSGLLASFNIPPNKEGTLWTVFEMSNGIITAINDLSYASDPSSINKPFKKPKNELIEFPLK
jgi:hypothetical protein